jgi:CBS domain-containing protein
MKTAEEILNEKEHELIFIGPEATILEAVSLMVERNIGAMLIQENDIITGIFTERDLLRITAREDFDPKTAKIKDHMTTNLLFANHDAPLYQLQDTVLGKRCRHLLVVKDGKYIGLLSAGDLTRASLNEKSQELSSVSWKYYEDWGWKKKR